MEVGMNNELTEKGERRLLKEMDTHPEQYDLSAPANGPKLTKFLGFNCQHLLRFARVTGYVRPPSRDEC